MITRKLREKLKISGENEKYDYGKAQGAIQSNIMKTGNIKSMKIGNAKYNESSSTRVIL